MADIQMHLTLVGDDFDTAKVTEITGIEPDYLRQKDELLGNGRVFGHTEWGIETSVKKDDVLEPFIDELMSKITCSAETLREVAEKMKAGWHVLFYVGVHDNDDTPCLGFDSEFVEFCGKIKASIGFDTYLYISRRYFVKPKKRR